MFKKLKYLIENNKYKKVLLVLLPLIIVLFLTLILTSKAFMKPVVANPAITSVSVSSCGTMTLSEETQSIGLTNAYPMSDNKGLTTTPYTFDVTNTCTTDSTFNVYLVVLTDSTIDESNIKVNLDTTGTSLVSDLTKYSLKDNINTQFQTKTGKIVKNTYLLDTKTITQNGTQSFNLRMWLDKNAGNENMNKTFVAAIAIGDSAESGNPMYLSDKIIQANGGKTAITAKTTPDFSKIAPEITSYTDNNFTGSTSTHSLTSTTSAYYVTYADLYTFDTTTGTYTLTNPQVGQYSAVYGSLANKYIVNYSLSSSSTVAKSSNLGTIYKITNATYNTSDATGVITYLTSSKTTNYDYSKDGMYSAPDDYGTSYYFRGAISNNWVSFAGFYWRIIRVNGDGSVRMIYSGSTAPTEAQAVVMTGAGNQEINDSTYAFNSTINSAEYVGYMYTLGDQHGYGTSSTIKSTIDTWYTSNLESFATKIADSVYCNDRSTFSGTIAGSNYNGTGTGDIATWFGAARRLINSSSMAPIGTGPSLSCPMQSDAFTVSDTTKGNAHLTNPVGLITADEVSMAGAIVGADNNSYYLYTGDDYWTGSPYYYVSIVAVEFGVDSIGASGSLYDSGVNNLMGVRPVISLKSTVTATGTGVWNDPYVVQ
jgi:hypothetical protein